nr:MFS transporter [Zophobihabitans entericus]
MEMSAAQSQTQVVKTRPLNMQDYKTLSLAALGGALEFYDFIIYVFFSLTIGHLFFPHNMPDWLTQVQTFGIFAAGYLARPFGGIIMAHFGDLFGRKRMFTFSILMMSVPTLLIGCLPTYDSIGIAAPLLLLLMRVCQGAAVGGEIPGAWTFVAEHVPTKRVGFACGTLTAGLVVGILIGSIVSTLIHKYVSDENMLIWGWRLPFLLGGVFGICSMYLRRWLKETPIFAEMQQRKNLDKNVPVVTVLKEHKHSVVISMLLTWVLSAGIMVVILLAPTYLQKVFSVDPVVALQANSLAIIGVALGCMLFGTLADKFGFAKVLIVGCAYCIVAVGVFYFSLFNHMDYLFITYPLAGFGVGVIGCFAFFMVRGFPPTVRFSGLSFSFNMAYAIAGGLTPLMMSLLTSLVSVKAHPYYVMILFGLGVLIGIYLLDEKKQNISGELK